MEYTATALIEADADRVWAVLTDGSSWTDWDSGVVRFEGRIEPGAKIKIYPEINPKRGFPLEGGRARGAPGGWSSRAACRSACSPVCAPTCSPRKATAPRASR